MFLNIVSGIVIYFLLWWLVIFAVLPWGNRAEERPEIGNAPSAPARPNLKKKVLATTLIAFVLWFPVNHLFKAELMALRAEAKAMALEDEKR